ncbi:MAG: glycosyltransferase family 39 protein [Candidatus Saccharimonadales bacterium]
MAKSLSDFFTYRYRYQIGYGFIIIAFITLLTLAGLYVPGGLSEGEMKSFVRTAILDTENSVTFAIPNMPFYAMQRFSMDILGPSTFAFKLPALICAFITGIGAVLLLRRWFRPNIAVLATIIMITTGQFLYVAQSGAASITFILWSVWLLLSATMITTSERHKNFWKILFFIIMSLSLYTPLSIYLVIAICSAGLLHPHVRYVLKKMSRQHLALLTLLSVIIVAPLCYLIYINPSLSLQLLGAPLPSTGEWPPDILENLKILLQQYLNFISPQSGVLMTPFFGLGSIALVLIGIWQLFKIRYTARSYTLTAWIVLLIPILVINPTYTSITFVPLLLLLASGLSYLLKSWYSMFPRNPYARFVGVVPLTILVGGLVVTGIGRYFDGYRYDPETASSFNRDLTLFNKQVRGKYSPTLFVEKSEKPFYDAIASYGGAYHKIIVTTAKPTKGDFVATKAAHNRIDIFPTRIITTDISKDSDRFYVYKN